jgi:UDP-glucose:tetrahydrobiopterin glucosyltransferase
VGRIDALDRVACRQRVEEQYSTEAMAERVEQWLDDVILAARAAQTFGYA